MTANIEFLKFIKFSKLKMGINGKKYYKIELTSPFLNT